MPAAESEFTAGSSPATGICWVVGRGGAVWRSVDGRTWQRVTFPEITDLSAVMATDARSASVSSVDGRTWQRVTFPEITDLSAVMATDARSASVSSADGRTFRTSDGGVTWTQR